MLDIRKASLDLIKNWQGRDEEERLRSLGLYRPDVLATFDLSKSLAFFDGDEPVAICGVDIIRAWDIGQLWLMTAPGFDRHFREMIRLGRCLIPFACAMTGFGTLATYVRHDDRRSMRFAASVGFVGVKNAPALVDFGPIGVMETLYLKKEN